MSYDLNTADNEEQEDNLRFLEFKKDYFSQIWFTYRSRFSPLNDSTVTTDMGWGCMLRSAQMMIARAFLNLNYGRGF